MLTDLVDGNTSCSHTPAMIDMETSSKQMVMGWEIVCRKHYEAGARQSVRLKAAIVQHRVIVKHSIGLLSDEGLRCCWMKWFAAMKLHLYNLEVTTKKGD